MNVIEIAILILTALALAFFVVVFADFASEYRRAKKRRRMEEEATAIAAALAALEMSSELDDKPKEKKEGDCDGKG